VCIFFESFRKTWIATSVRRSILIVDKLEKVIGVLDKTLARVEKNWRKATTIQTF